MSGESSCASMFRVIVRGLWAWAALGGDVRAGAHLAPPPFHSGRHGESSPGVYPVRAVSAPHGELRERTLCCQAHGIAWPFLTPEDLTQLSLSAWLEPQRWVHWLSSERRQRATCGVLPGRLAEHPGGVKHSALDARAGCRSISCP